MANISNELNEFKNAIYGEDIRDNLISAVTVLNDSLEAGIKRFDTDQEKASVSEANALAYKNSCKAYNDASIKRRNVNGVMTHLGEYTFNQAEEMRTNGVLNDGECVRIIEGIATTDDFIEGSGHTYDAGATFVYKASENKWCGLNQYDVMDNVNAHIDAVIEQFNANVASLKETIISKNGTVEDATLNGIQNGIESVYEAASVKSVSSNAIDSETSSAAIRPGQHHNIVTITANDGTVTRFDDLGTYNYAGGYAKGYSDAVPSSASITASGVITVYNYGTPSSNVGSSLPVQYTKRFTEDTYTYNEGIHYALDKIQVADITDKCTVTISGSMKIDVTLNSDYSLTKYDAVYIIISYISRDSGALTMALYTKTGAEFTSSGISLTYYSYFSSATAKVLCEYRIQDPTQNSDTGLGDFDVDDTIVG